MATYSSVLAWRIPGLGKPGGLPSMAFYLPSSCTSKLHPVGPRTCLMTKTTHTKPSSCQLHGASAHGPSIPLPGVLQATLSTCSGVTWNNDSLYHFLGFPGGLDGKESACSAGDLGSIPGSGRSPGEGNSNPLQYSCLENPMDGGVWSATVHGIAKAQLSDFSFFLSLSLPTPLTPVSIYLPIY